MAVKIRLRRMGQKKAPFYRIVVADGRAPRDGKFIEEIGTYDPTKDPSEFKVDEEAAKVVREIYSMYANGIGYFKICKYLNENKIPTPSKYKKLQGLKYVCPYYPNGSEFWNIDSVRKILLDEVK